MQILLIITVVSLSLLVVLLLDIFRYLLIIFRVGDTLISNSESLKNIEVSKEYVDFLRKYPQNIEYIDLSSLSSREASKLMWKNFKNFKNFK